MAEHLRVTLSEGLSDGDIDSQLNLPKITIDEEELERRALSNEERMLALVDLYGRKDPVELETNRQLEAFEREMSLLPIKQKRALHKGYTVKQARLFLSIENNDPRRAVKRMAAFWEKRFKLYGDDALLRRTEEDFRRFYKMALEALTDAEVDRCTKLWAEQYVREWKRGYLLRFDQELAEIPDHEKGAIVEAANSRPDVVMSEEHRLHFLYCEDFDAERACRRMVKYWDMAFELFGREGALRSVTVNDLLRDHPSEMSVGFIWSTLGTDNFGRPLIYCAPGKLFASMMAGQGCTEEGVLKVIWYVFHAMMEEVKSCHEKGCVLLVDDRDMDFSAFNPKLASKGSSIMFDCLPMKAKALHLFPPASLSVFQLLLPFVKWVVGKRMRLRLCVHNGTDQKSLSDLEACGISRDLIPTTLGGNIDVDQLGRAWLEERREAGL